MVTLKPSAEHHEYERLLLRLLEEGRRSSSRPPAATAVPSPPPPGVAPCTTSEPRVRTPAWASAIRWFSNTLWLVIMVGGLAPIAMQATSKFDVFICVGIFLTIFAIPVIGYVVTWDQPGYL